MQYTNSLTSIFGNNPGHTPQLLAGIRGLNSNGLLLLDHPHLFHNLARPQRMPINRILANEPAAVHPVHIKSY